MAPRPSRPRSCTLLAALGALALLALAPAHGAEIAPHVASYRLKLDTADVSSGVAAIQGRLEIRLEASCDGWTMQQFVAFNLLTEDEASLEHLALLKAFESRDGTEYVFSSQTWEDRELVEHLAGSARRHPGGTVSVRYSKPAPDSATLPVGSLFPTAHIAALVDAAQRGARQLTRVVFDGSTSDNPFEVSTYIARERRSPVELPPPLSALAGRRLWPMRLAYFRPGALEPQAEFEMSVELYEQGVAGHMVFDYGDFAMDVRLEEVSVQPPPRCDS